MAYDEELAERIREAVAAEPGITEQRMFGGLAFLVHGRLALAAGNGGAMLLRVDPSRADELAAQQDVEPFRMRGREMDGWLRVGTEAVTTDEALRRWVAVGLERARSLPTA